MGSGFDSIRDRSSAHFSENQPFLAFPHRQEAGQPFLHDFPDRVLNVPLCHSYLWVAGKAISYQLARPLTACALLCGGRLQLFDADVAEGIGLAFLSMVLEAKVALGIHVILVVGA